MAKSFAELFKAAEQSPTYQLEHVRMAFVGETTRLMDAQDVSRAELARRLDVSRAYITKLLNGNANITLDTMVRVAMALDAKVNLAMTEKNRQVRWFGCIDGGKNRLMKQDRELSWGGSKFKLEGKAHEKIAA